LLARRDVPEASLEEGSPDHLGASLDVAEANEMPAAPPAAKPAAIAAQVIPAALTEREAAREAGSGRREDHPEPSALTTASLPAASFSAAQSENSTTQKLPASGTVVLDVEEGGIVVPSFLGKNLRVAMEAAQDAGLDLDAIGSGVAREQSPQPGARVAAGSRITVRFGR